MVRTGYRPWHQGAACPADATDYNEPPGERPSDGPERASSPWLSCPRRRRWRPRLSRDRLLATKLHIPRPRPGFLARPRLLDRLTEGTAQELTLVSAPAGFGKTSLLGDWARRSRRPVAWLSLDGGDSDPARFWRYVAAALDRVRPGVRRRVDALFQGGQPPFEAVLSVLVNKLVEELEEVVLVLDDYHLVEAPAVHDSLAVLLERLPPQLRLVLASRADPPLPLARLRAGGQLTELREADLRFTPEEAAALLRAAVGAELPEAAVAALGRTDRRMGRRAAAGRPVAAGPRRRRTPLWRGSRAATAMCWIICAEEVLDRQPEPLRAFLLETSILERLSGPLCAAVTGRADSQELLEQAERANLFLYPLDEVRGWWRYHRLFADLLRARLPAGAARSGVRAAPGRGRLARGAGPGRRGHRPRAGRR